MTDNKLTNANSFKNYLTKIRKTLDPNEQLDVCADRALFWELFFLEKDIDIFLKESFLDLKLIISNNYLFFSENWTNEEKIIQAIFNKETDKINIINLEKNEGKYNETINIYLKDNSGNYHNNVIIRPNINYDESICYKINDLPNIQVNNRLSNKKLVFDKILQRLPY